MYFALKVMITALVVALASELARRSSLFAALIVSLPLTSILAMIWLYRDTGDTAKVAALSWDILWLVVPSMLFFVALPLLLQQGLKFWPALLVACAIMAGGYQLFLKLKGSA